MSDIMPFMTEFRFISYNIMQSYWSKRSISFIVKWEMLFRKIVPILETETKFDLFLFNYSIVFSKQELIFI